MHRRPAALLITVLVFAAFAAAPSAAAAPTTELISVSSTGAPSNVESAGWPPGMSADRRFVVFNSYAANLVPGDTNNRPDVFIRDRVLGTTERISMSSSGAQANSFNYGGSISADGRYVVFASEASNLVRGDTNNLNDVFVHDCLTGTTRRVDVSAAGEQADGMANFDPVISADGRYVAFSSIATNLLGGHDNDGTWDVFRKNLITGAIKNMSVFARGADPTLDSDAGAADISPNGRFVVFVTDAELTKADANDGVHEEDVYLRDRLTKTTDWISRPGPSGQHDGEFLAAVSGHGRFVAFESDAPLVAADTNNADDIYVRDRKTGTTRRVSVASTGAQTPALSVSQAPDISDDGRYVSFESNAPDLIANDANGTQFDIFLRDMTTGITELVDRSSTGAQADIDSNAATLSSAGNYVLFWSRASNFVPDDAFVAQVYLRGPLR